ncbi:MAG: nucleoside-diphosphate kinase [Armatimonadetes bacterium]|nr:nucleoside-diphosphate kinase [Armatimonadota bacterium]
MENCRPTEKTSDPEVQHTFVLVKPDAVRRKLVGEIISRLERSGLELVAAQLVRPTRELAELHYGPEIAERWGEDVRRVLLDYICSGPCLATVWAGRQAVVRARQLVGEKPQPSDCATGTIRKDLGVDTIEKSRAEGRALENLVHAADSPQAAEQEISLWGLSEKT